MQHSPIRRRYHPGRRGTPRLLRCEPLEHRWLLSITVDTLVDEADGSIEDGDISLRDAIAAAEAGEMIDFDASLDGGTILLTMGELVVERSITIDATELPAVLRSTPRGMILPRRRTTATGAGSSISTMGMIRPIAP